MKERAIQVDDRLDLTLTLKGARVIATDPSFRFASGEVWHATWTAEGPATLRMRRVEDEIVASAWGAGGDSALEGLAALIGLEDRDADLFRPAQEPLRSLARRWRGLSVPRTQSVFQALVPAILVQKVAGKEAARSYLQLVRRLGEPAPGPLPGLILPPRPQLLARTGYEVFHPFGIERRRAETIRRAASRAERLEEIPCLGLEAGYARLESIRGVGQWTAAKVMYGACGDADALPLGDYNLPSLVSWNLAGEPRGDDRRMLHLLEPYRGQRGRVVHWLELGGRHPPRFGPRRPLRRIWRE